MHRLIPSLFALSLIAGPAHAGDLHLLARPLRGPTASASLNLDLPADPVAPPEATEWKQLPLPAVLALSACGAAAIVLLAAVMVSGQGGGNRSVPFWTFT